MRWWYGVAVTALVWAIGTVMLGADTEGSSVLHPISDGLVLLMLVTWLVMPLCLYLDQRAYSEELAWDPSLSLWLLASFVWFLNVAVGIAYCLRRSVAARQTPPSRQWASVLLASIVFWAGAVALDAAVPEQAFSTPLYDLMTVLVLATWIAMAIAIHLDAVRVRGYTDWNPDSRLFVVGTAIPFVNVLVGAAYLYKRREALEGVDVTEEFTPTVSVAESRSGVERSPWFRRAAIVFGVYVLAMVGVGAAAPSLSGDAFELVAIAAWIPFGPFFAVCVYKDAAWRRDHDRSVGDGWWLYLLSGVIQGIGFWYLVRRAAKVNRYRIRRETKRAED